MTSRPITLTAAMLALLTAALWGANPVAVSYSVDALPPVAVAALRFAMATAVMWIWCRVEGTPLGLAPNQRGPVLIAGVLMFVQIASFNWGVVRSNSSHSTMLINTAVFWVTALEHLVTHTDRLTPRKLLGLLVAAAGVGAVFWSENRQSPSSGLDRVTLAGDLILLGSAFLLAIKIVFVKQAVQRVEPAKLIFWHNVVALVGFSVFSLAFETYTPGRLTWPAVLGVVYQGVFVAGFCFAIQALLLRHHSASQIAVFGFATPLFGVGLGIALRGDPFSWSLLVAVACVTIGILLVHTSRK